MNDIQHVPAQAKRGQLLPQEIMSPWVKSFGKVNKTRLQCFLFLIEWVHACIREDGGICSPSACTSQNKTESLWIWSKKSAS